MTHRSEEKEIQTDWGLYKDTFTRKSLTTERDWLTEENKKEILTDSGLYKDIIKRLTYRLAGKGITNRLKINERRI